MVFKRYQGKNFSDLKKDLIEIVINKISPIRQEMIKLTNDEKYLEDILKSGSGKAQQIASGVLKEVYDATGLKF